MSLTSKIVLGASVVVSAGIIYVVQAKQCSDREKMHQGVVRDKEIHEKRKAENLYLLQQQQEFAEALRKGNDEEVSQKILQGDKDGQG